MILLLRFPFLSRADATFDLLFLFILSIFTEKLNMKTNDACSCVSKRVAVVDIVRIFTNMRLETAAVATECVYQSVKIHDVFSESWCQ